MGDSGIYQNDPGIGENYGSIFDRSEFFGFNSNTFKNSQKFLVKMMKYSLLFGADRALMTTKSSARSKGINQISSLHQSDRLDDMAIPEASGEKTKATCHVRENLDTDKMSKMVKFHSAGYIDFPLKMFIFPAVLVLELISIQFSLFASFFTIPIWLSYSLVMLPIQTLMGIKRLLLRRLSRMRVELISYITSSIYARVSAKKSILNLGVKFRRALVWAVSVCFVLIGLLLSGVLVGGLVTRRFVEQPVQITRTLDFDYTKERPVAFVPEIPCSHKLQLTVTLTLPESEYNRQLGMFQVEFYE